MPKWFYLFTWKEKLIYYLLRWWVALATLFEGLVSVFSLGTCWPGWSFQATYKQILYELDCAKKHGAK